MWTRISQREPINASLSSTVYSRCFSYSTNDYDSPMAYSCDDQQWIPSHLNLDLQSKLESLGDHDPQMSCDQSRSSSRDLAEVWFAHLHLPAAQCRRTSLPLWQTLLHLLLFHVSGRFLLESGNLRCQTSGRRHLRMQNSQPSGKCGDQDSSARANTDGHSAVASRRGTRLSSGTRLYHLQSQYFLHNLALRQFRSNLCLSALPRWDRWEVSVWKESFEISTDYSSCSTVPLGPVDMYVQATASQRETIRPERYVRIGEAQISIHALSTLGVLQRLLASNHSSSSLRCTMSLILFALLLGHHLTRRRWHAHILHHQRRTVCINSQITIAMCV